MSYILTNVASRNASVSSPSIERGTGGNYTTTNGVLSSGQFTMLGMGIGFEPTELLAIFSTCLGSKLPSFANKVRSNRH
jgi:hypothetical protein